MHMAGLLATGGCGALLEWQAAQFSAKMTLP
jgi:hypothetical protein